MFSRHRSIKLVLSLVLVSLLALLSTGATSENMPSLSHRRGLRYTVIADSPRLNREVQGVATAYVDGVPAEPVDSFVWDGEGSTPIKGHAVLRIDPISNSGTILVRWRDRNGAWTLRQTAFAPPDHPSGLRLGPGAGDTTFVQGDPVPVDVYLHGDTTAGGPVLPTIFNMLATWGPAEVTLNGKPFENPFDGPTPLWIAHTMTTVGARDEDGVVHNSTGGIFVGGGQAADGSVDYDDLEYHVVFHDAPGPEPTSNFPPPLQFFYHLTFEDVKVTITQGD